LGSFGRVRENKKQKNPNKKYSSPKLLRFLRSFENNRKNISALKALYSVPSYNLDFRVEKD